MNSFSLKRFLIVTLIVSLWINASEVFRYFTIVMPGTRAFLSSVPAVAPMNLSVFGLWFIWDMILTALTIFMHWLMAAKFGNSLGTAITAGSLSWTFFFGLFWMAMLNMNLAAPSLALIALPLAWFELVVASLISFMVTKRPKWR